MVMIPHLHPTIVFEQEFGNANKFSEKYSYCTGLISIVINQQRSFASLEHLEIFYVARDKCFVFKTEFRFLDVNMTFTINKEKLKLLTKVNLFNNFMAYTF